MANIEYLKNRAIIEPEDLTSLLASDDQQARIKLVDATFVMPNSGHDPHHSFAAKRIGNAVFFDIEKIADPYSELPHMLPNADKFSVDISNLGIGNDDFIVIYGQNGMVMGPARAWWMFKAFGHESVAVLNGGLPAWEKAGLPTIATPPKNPEKTVYQANYQKQWVASRDDMLDAIAHDSTLILDARPAGRFSGSTPEPRPGLASGHIPGSHSLPCTDLVSPETGKLQPEGHISDMLERFSAGDSSKIITTCGSGVTACMISLALFHVQSRIAPVYDGSWSEWGIKNLNLPIEI